MTLRYVVLILVHISAFVLAQNATTTLTTSFPVSTVVSRVVFGGSTRTVAASTIFSLQTITSSVPTATASPTPDTAISSYTHIDAAFGVLGGLLILTGLPSAFWGHKNRWSSFFIIGFYTLAVVCMALIIRFGVLDAVEPPSETLRGLFVLSSAVAGVIGGGIAIFFWKGTKYFIGAWGGFSLGLFIQCMHDGGLIQPLGFRYALYIGCAVIGFVLCTIPRLHYQVLLAATGIVGASAFILGVDCFTCAGLKEFYVYNLGFDSLFPQFYDTPFRVSQTMQIELGMMGAVAVMGMAVQARVLIALQTRLREINAEQDRKNAEVEARAADRFTQMDQELEDWERQYGRGSSRNRTSKLDDLEANRTITPESHRNSSSRLSLFKSRRHQGRSSLTMADLTSNAPQTPKVEEEPKPELKVDFGESVEQSMPQSFVSPEGTVPKPLTDEARNNSLRKSMELISEIQDLRASIQALKGETSPRLGANESTALLDSEQRETYRDGGPSRSRAISAGTPFPVNTKTTVGTGPRNANASAPRPSSTPQLNQWDDYVKNRSLFQPPSGVSQPATPTAVHARPHSISMPLAVATAVEQRQRLERAFEHGGPDAYRDAGSSSEHGSRPTSALLGSFSKNDYEGENTNRRRAGSGGRSLMTVTARPVSQVHILPPKPSPSKTPEAPVVKTFEELSARHREKIKALQDPLSQQTAEEAKVAEAKSRWERSLAVEKAAMSKKEREVSKNPTYPPHARSSSAGGLLADADPHKRSPSTAKVHDWQQYQDATLGEGRQPGRPRPKSPAPLSGMGGSMPTRNR